MVLDELFFLDGWGLHIDQHTTFSLNIGIIGLQKRALTKFLLVSDHHHYAYNNKIPCGFRIPEDPNGGGG